MAGKASLKRAEDFTDFLNASPTPFHAVQSAKLRLEKAGFKQIKVCDCTHVYRTEHPPNNYLLGTRPMVFLSEARRKVLPDTQHEHNRRLRNRQCLETW